MMEYQDIVDNSARHAYVWVASHNPLDRIMTYRDIVDNQAHDNQYPARIQRNHFNASTGITDIKTLYILQK